MHCRVDEIRRTNSAFADLEVLIFAALLPHTSSPLNDDAGSAERQLPDSGTGRGKYGVCYRRRRGCDRWFAKTGRRIVTLNEVRFDFRRLIDAQQPIVAEVTLPRRAVGGARCIEKSEERSRINRFYKRSADRKTSRFASAKLRGAYPPGS